MGARILVADDSVTIQKVVELTFSKEDFALVQARSGEEAIRKAMEVRPDLVLVDLVMPDKNGYEVCAALRAEPTLRSVPIILLTGTFETFDKEQGFRAGANDFVTKPFESQVLISKVKQLLFARMVEKGAAAAAPGGSRLTAPRVQAAPTPTDPMVAPTPAVPVDAGPLSPAAAATLNEEGLNLDLSPPTEETSQDRPWQLPDSTPPPAPVVPESAAVPGKPGELSLEDVMVLELAELGRVGGAQSAEADALALSEGLSLEDLLSTPPVTPAPMPQVEPLVEEAAPSDSGVFDLTAELGAPPLSITEAASDELPTFSVEDLLGTPAVGSPGFTPVPGEIAESELGSKGEGLTAEALPSVEPLAPDASRDLKPDEERPLAALEASTLETPLAEAAEAEEPPAGEDWTIEAEAPVSPGVPEIPPVTAAGEASVSAASSEQQVTFPSLASGVDALQPTIPFLPGMPEADVASMRQAVTERVARDLARELSDKLVDRIEKIVWEVVPDLAEILITKEIERIRAMADSQKPS